MSLTPLQCKKLICEESLKFGIDKIGFSKAEPIDRQAQEAYCTWIKTGRHGEMEYLAKYEDIRNDPRLLLHDAKTVISCAINYFPRVKQDTTAPQIASYALGQDYHEVVRNKLMLLSAFIKNSFGGDTRVCVDTAPIRERYHAVKSGLGFIGINNQLIIPGHGSYFFLGEIITTLQLPVDTPNRHTCMKCGRCIKECPGNAISPDGSFDARRCLSYLTIEYRGDLPDNLPIGNRVYGCDTCQEVCPHNINATPSPVKEFTPTESLLNLDRQAMESMSQEQFSAIFRHSAIKRTKYAGFMRNLRATKNK